jgi:hypothetical protein
MAQAYPTHSGGIRATPEEALTMRTILLGAVIIGSLFAEYVRAEIPRKVPPADDTLQAVLDRVHKHAESDAWKEPGFRDDAIEAWLDKLVGSVAKAANLPDLKLPTRFADVKSGEPTGRLPEGLLIIGKNVESLALRNSIVLADGNIEMLRAENCVIIARCVASVQQPRGCLIVAGVYCDSDIDGEPRTRAGGSLIISRGFANVGTANGSIIVAPLGLTSNRLVDALLVNTPPPQPSRENAADRRIIPGRQVIPKSVDIADLPLERMFEHPLVAKIELLGLFEPNVPPPLRFGRPEERPQAIIIRFENRRYLANLNQPILDESERPVEALRDWKLAFASRQMAIFSNGDSDAVVRMQKQ